MPTEKYQSAVSTLINLCCFFWGQCVVVLHLPDCSFRVPIDCRRADQPNTQLSPLDPPSQPNLARRRSKALLSSHWYSGSFPFLGDKSYYNLRLRNFARLVPTPPSTSRASFFLGVIHPSLPSAGSLVHRSVSHHIIQSASLGTT